MSINISNPLVRDAVYEAFHGKCFYTGDEVTMKSMGIDHIVPRSRGGTDCFNNYALCERRFNIQKSNHRLDNERSVLYKIQNTFAKEAFRVYNRLRLENNKEALSECAKSTRPSWIEHSTLWTIDNAPCWLSLPNYKFWEPLVISKSLKTLIYGEPVFSRDKEELLPLVCSIAWEHRGLFISFDISEVLFDRACKEYYVWRKGLNNDTKNKIVKICKQLAKSGRHPKEVNAKAASIYSACGSASPQLSAQ